ncbi:DNA mismatch repair protein [Clostridium sp. D2Q-14]|uniref:MutS-related protein n=1 Tax=Anaeromonas gelatinilytica TaxID=2683194 RepID=UPI00193C1A4A|nr:DNA mismatch repair protein [Anaeromonas gelatinilytica]MBS4534184.1 DNA mismatch repair protein [Anaeromonas gelatinilytica]
MQKSKKIYQKRKKKYSKLSTKTNKIMNIVSLIRLITAIIFIIVAVFLFMDIGGIILWATLLFILGVFLYLIRFHNKLKGLHEYLIILTNINSKSIDRVEGNWNTFKDRGEEYVDENHDYTFDLDIFGQNSLFQYINSAYTSEGRNRLAYILSNIPKNKDNIYERQEAIKELSKKRWFRQRLLAEGMTIKVKSEDNKSLVEWARRKNSFYDKGWIKVIIKILPLITITALIAGYGFEIISKSIPIYLVIIQILMGFLNSNNINKEFNEVYRYQDEIKVYWKMLNIFEKGKFKSSYLLKLRNRIKNEEGHSAIIQLRELDKIVERILNRKNMLFLPIKIVTLWDYQCLIRLHKWKKQSGSLVKEWLSVVGELEALSSLALLGYDNPDWAIPEITDEESVIISQNIAHPLLRSDAVSNSIKIEDPSRIVLITGSNMAGKSTFLRTIGINIVLAYSGSSICGEKLRCSLMNLQTCMRISDDLEEGVSSFYGELKRINNIVKASEGKEQVFFLLDEIFKGTNSYDRHLGAKMLLKQLYKNNGIGLVSTHDLELGELEKTTKGNVLNYHFKEYYKDGKIHFDYKLKRGVSTTRNAIYLMKMAGVKIEDL